MKKIVLLLVISTCFFGCNHYMNKSIFEPLTREEIKKSVDKGSLFEEMYKDIQLMKEYRLKTELEQAEYSKLTYKRLYKFMKFMQDSTYFKPINKKIGKEWENRYGVYLTKIDSVSDYWEKYKEENSLNQYVDIELVKIDKKIYSYIGGVSDIYLGFQLTPLKGTIDQIKFGYRMEKKDAEKNPMYDRELIYCADDTPFSISTVKYWETEHAERIIFESLTLEEFLSEYNFYIEVDEITQEGKTMKTADLEIPKSVESYWTYVNTKYFNADFYENMIHETLYSDYVGLEEYQNREIKKILDKKDALSNKFVRLGGNLKKVKLDLDY